MHNTHRLPPLRFTPLLKSTIWGGSDIVRLKGLPPTQGCVGESWEVSGVAGSETRVAGGDFAGETLATLTARYGSALVGERNRQRYGTDFPLLVKFLSADRDLSIQVHPDDMMAQRLGHPYGKTEMWYIVHADPGAMIGSGFSHSLSPDEFAEHLRRGTLCNDIQQHDSRSGDCFLIPAGRIHSIGAGNFLIEVQQSSDDTFRVYDFGRLDHNGSRRALHTDLAMQALDFSAETDYRTHYLPHVNQAVTLVDRREFTTRLYQLDRPLCGSYAAIDSFLIFVAFEGAARFTTDAGDELVMRAGETVLFPATTQRIVITPESSQPFGCLETFIR